MQKCLNEDRAHLFKQFKKHPWILLIIIFFIASGVAIFTVSLLCKVSFPCTDDQQNYALFFGLNICLISVIFIGLPCFLTSFINCIYYDTIKEPVLPVTTRSPLTSREPRARSNSREKIPPSPKGPVPSHGMQSFKEYHSEA